VVAEEKRLEAGMFWLIVPFLMITCNHQGSISLFVCVQHAYVSICVAACICLGLCLAIYMYVRVPVYICVHMPSRQTVGSSLPTTCRLAVT